VNTQQTYVDLNDIGRHRKWYCDIVLTPFNHGIRHCLSRPALEYPQVPQRAKV